MRREAGRGYAELVLKFGGAALAGTARLRLAAARVEALVRAGRVPVVVVSATGRSTDRLLVRGGRLAPGTAPEGPAGSDPDPGREGLDAADPAVRREWDRLLATGESRAAALLALALARRGLAARSLAGGEAGIQVLPDGDAVVDPTPLRVLLDRGWIPVVAGFQGVDRHGETRTLGRGGSDLTAVALAQALQARECVLVKDVRGIYPPDPADPRRPRPGSAPLRSLSPEALEALAGQGARVVQLAAARRAREAGVCLRFHHYRAHPLRPGGTVVAEAREEDPWTHR